MTPPERRLWLDWQTSRYLEAIENHDFETQEELWALAAHDAELEAAFHETHEAILEESLASTTEELTNAVEKHLSSGEIVTAKAGPVTVSDVAEELFHHAGKSLAAGGYAWVEKLRSSTDPLPEDLKLSKLTAWAEAKFGNAPAGFWKVFHQVVLKLEQRRASETEYALAARRAPKPEGTE